MQRKKIVQKLLEKGISKEVVENLLDEIYEEERTFTTLPDEMELGQKLLAKKNYDIENNAKDRQKAFGYLVRHGISSEVTLKLLKEY